MMSASDLSAEMVVDSSRAARAKLKRGDCVRRCIVMD